MDVYVQRLPYHLMINEDGAPHKQGNNACLSHAN